jgi:site-specific recombinase XerD
MDTLPVAIIRGISNYADCYKTDKWQPYAAAATAAYAKGLLKEQSEARSSGSSSDKYLRYCNRFYMYILARSRREKDKVGVRLRRMPSTDPRVLW